MQWILASLTLLVFQNGGSISGYILKMGGGDPLSKAVVTITARSNGRTESYSATTGADGRFSFQNLNPGEYRISGARSGYVRMEYGARTPNSAGLPITITAGQAVKDVVLQLIPAGAISGRVFDRDGEALANVAVEALKYSYQQGRRLMNVVQTARTDDRGEYRLFWLQPGQYFVSATPAAQRGAVLNPSNVAGPGIGGAAAGAGGGRGGPRGNAGRGGGPRGGGAASAPPAPLTEDEPAEGYVPVYYPGTIDEQSAAPIVVAPGADFGGVDLTVEKVRTVLVDGQVINGLTGQPAQNATVVLVPGRQNHGGRGLRGGRDLANFRSRVNQGAFEIRGVVPGDYEIAATLNDRSSRMTARLPLDIGNADVHNVALVLTPGTTITGRVSLEGEQGGAGNSDLPRMRVMLRSDSPGPVPGGAQTGAVQPDGAFAVPQVGGDDYRVSVAGLPRNAYVKSARYGATDVMSEGLHVDGQPAASLEIVVSTTSGAVDGLVRDDKDSGAVNVIVALVPAADSRMDLYRTTSTDAGGRFHLEGVAPGNYRAFAWETVETGAWEDPDFIQQFEDRGAPVRIDENATTSVEMRVIPTLR